MATGLKGEILPMRDLFSASLGRTVHLHKGDMFTKRLDPVSFQVAVARANLRRMKPRTA